MFNAVVGPLAFLDIVTGGATTRGILRLTSLALGCTSTDGLGSAGC
jgi:hypothetical protein